MTEHWYGLFGRDRIEADRAWRSSEARRDFEVETGLTDEKTEAYQAQFVQWAARRLERS